VQRNIRVQIALALVVASVACGRGKSERSAAGNVAPPSSTQPTVAPSTPYGPPTAAVETTQTTSKHHSKLAGAAAGAAAGHMLGGHSVTGAAAGALYQHERNKHKK
jgi:hypothetical protein